MDTPTSTLITGDILKKVVPNLPIERANFLSDLINKICPVYGINSKDILREFIAQVAHESIGFSAKTENLNYSAQAILNTWPSRFKTIQEAQPFARNPQALANKVYNGRMGNATGSNDGWDFRGSGFMQATGRDSIVPYFNFKKAGKGYVLPETFATPDDLVNLIRIKDTWAMDAACWEFSISKNLNALAVGDDLANFVKITKEINGGLIGEKSREDYFARAKQFII